MLRKVRIARVSTVPFFVFAQLGQQLESLAALGASVFGVTSEGADFDRLLQLRDVRMVKLSVRRAISPVRDFITLVRLFLFFKAQRIEISHSTTPKAGLLSALAAYLAGVPVRLHTFTGQPWIHLHGFKRMVARWSDRLVLRLNTHCFADSVGQMEFLLAQGLARPDQLSVIGAGSLSGVDGSRFDPERFSERDRSVLRARHGIPADAPLVLFLGRITVDKGVRELLAAFQELKSGVAAAHLLLVGQFDVDSGVADRDLKQALDCVADAHVVGYSRCPEAYLAITDVLCLPSYREGFGTVVIEAAAMGVPTVGSDIYGLSDAVVQGQTGLLVPPKNVDQLAQALETLLLDKSLRSAMGQAARARARDLFDARTVNQLLADAYDHWLRVVRS
ncbi:MAG: glycosyltransferase [Rhodoferax sp.]|nr:glycosyltransferase [Rhodoferax sp.]MCF8207886.1 glycosyltransferase [Rhodoferax sp.]